MSSRAYWESDSMMPERVHPPTARAIEMTLQLAINQKLMDRLDALERKVKELEHRQAV
jgi:hypothetical protein